MKLATCNVITVVFILTILQSCVANVDFCKAVCQPCTEHWEGDDLHNANCMVTAVAPEAPLGCLINLEGNGCCTTCHYQYGEKPNGEYCGGPDTGCTGCYGTNCCPGCPSPTNYCFGCGCVLGCLHAFKGENKISQCEGICDYNYGYDRAKINGLYLESISGCESNSNGKTYDCDIHSNQTITMEGGIFNSSKRNLTIDDVRVDLDLSGNCDVIKVEQNRILCNLSFHNVNLGSRNGVIRVCILNGSCSNDLFLGFKNPILTNIGSLGTTKGGTLVSITGNHFGPSYVQASLNVIIGNVEINATLENYNLITFLSPPGFGMNKSIQVIIQDSKLELTSDYFLPVVSQVICAPTNQNGGTIQFKGREFGISNPPDGFVITFEIIKQEYIKSTSKTITCLNPTWVSFSELTCFFPEEGIGIDVGNVLITSSGYNIVVDKGLCFKEPSILDISPKQGSVGEIVTIVGTGFGTFTGSRGLISVSFLSKNEGEKFSCFAGCGNTTTSSSHSCLVAEGYGSNLSVSLKLGNVKVNGNIFFSYFNSNSKALIRSFYPHFGTVWGGTEVILSAINVYEGDVCNFHITLGTNVSIFTSTASILNITSEGTKNVKCITPPLSNIDFSSSEKALVGSRFSISNSDAHDFYFYVTRNANFFCSSKMTSFEGPISGKQSSGETMKVGVSSFELKKIIGMVPPYELPFLSNGIFCIFSAKNVSKIVKAELHFDVSGYSFVCPLPHFSKQVVAEVKITINNQDLFSLSSDDDGIYCNQSTNFSFVECPRGTYAKLPELPCLPCPLDSFASFEGSSRCQPCPFNSFTREKGSKSIDDCFCPENSCKVEFFDLSQFSKWNTMSYHQILNDTAACIPCEENLKCSSNIWRKAKCPSGTLFMNMEHSTIDNYTSSSSFHLSNSLISSCPSKLGCFGGDNVHTCRIGFTGTGCLRCMDGYGEFGVPTTCWKCSQGSKYLGFMCYLLIPSIIILVSFKSSKKSSRNIPILLKMFSNHVMILMALSCLPFKYPTWLYSMFNVFTIFGGLGTPGGHSDSETGGMYSYSEENGFTGLGSLFSLDCTLGFQFYSQETRFDAKTILYAIYPFILVLFVFFLVYLWELIAYLSRKCSRAYCDCFKEKILHAKSVGSKLKRLSTKMIKSSSMDLQQPQIELESFAKPRRLSAVSLGEEVKIESVSERVSSESINYVVNKQFISELERKVSASEKISTSESLSGINLVSVNKMKEHRLSGNVDAAQKERILSEKSKFNDKSDNKKLSNADVREHDFINSQGMKAPKFNAIIVSLNLVIFVAVTGLFSSLQCVPLLKRHYSLQTVESYCFEGHHAQIVGSVSLPFLFLYCIVYEIFLFHYMKPIGETDLAISKSLEYLTLGYKRETYKWELVITIRKFLLSATSIVGVTSSMDTLLVRISFILMILSISTVLHLLYVPFENRLFNKLELYSLVCSTLSLGLGLNMATNADESVIIFVSLLFLILNLSFFFFWAYHFSKAILKTKWWKKSKFRVYIICLFIWRYLKRCCRKQRDAKAFGDQPINMKS